MKLSKRKIIITSFWVMGLSNSFASIAIADSWSVTQNVYVTESNANITQNVNNRTTQAANLINTPDSTISGEQSTNVSSDNIKLKQVGGTQNSQAINLATAKKIDVLQQLFSAENVTLEQKSGTNNIQAINIANTSTDASAVKQMISVAENIQFSQDASTSHNIQAGNYLESDTVTISQQQLDAKSVSFEQQGSNNIQAGNVAIATTNNDITQDFTVETIKISGGNAVSVANYIGTNN